MTTSPWRRRGSRLKGTSPALAPSSSLPSTPPLVRASALPHPLVSLPGFALARPRVLAPFALPHASLTPSHPSRASSRPSRPRLACLAPSHRSRRSHPSHAPLHRRAGSAPLPPFRARRALFAPHHRAVAPSRPSRPSRARPPGAFLFAPSLCRLCAIFAPSHLPAVSAPSHPRATFAPSCRCASLAPSRRSRPRPLRAARTLFAPLSVPCARQRHPRRRAVVCPRSRRSARRLTPSRINSRLPARPLHAPSLPLTIPLTIC
ncbi:hypothetical protein DENSPDRAFT_226047 [Dentipellis sp. KUC8613]|nr:hypothetical protein DENSPDRAFT_226047 [Dentipellis sp. KUC8613]